MLADLICSSGLAQPVRISHVEPVRRPYASAVSFSYRQGDSVVHLSYFNNNLIIYLASEDHNPEYRYKVSSLLPQYVNTRDTFVVLPNLPNGELLFEVQNIHQSNFPPAHLKIIVESPLWLRWWFLPMMFLYGLLFVSAFLYLFYRYRLRQFMRLQRVRDRIARDLHDDMGSYLSSISIMSQTARRSAMKDPAKTQATLERIGQTARQVMDSMGDIVWSINPTHDSMEQVVARMTDVASSLFAWSADQAVHVALDMDVAAEVRQLSLSAENRRDFFLIYKEAVTNVAKYAKASHVRVSLRREGANLVLVVQDDGQGFNTQSPVRQNPSGGNGLRNMQTRAALLNGTLTVESTIGQGANVTLRFPV
ncbi:sensor histidine kinase [Spirosoma sp. BT704]|uniref:Sensor histidine kinase n=2 Tax=Spirosoma validum TaxID=2771355 RepID=A0A927B4W9_9BACT|nr:sensor histidine kinase [Spirosoma validum]